MEKGTSRVQRLSGALQNVCASQSRIATRCAVLLPLWPWRHTLMVEKMGVTESTEIKKKDTPFKRKKPKNSSLAGVPEGPCGIPELKTFQEALPLCQLKVLSVTPPICWSTRDPLLPTRLFASSKMGPITTDVTPSRFSSTNHTSAMSVTGDTTLKITKNHPCDGKWCPSCKRLECPDFKEVKHQTGPGKSPSPTFICTQCHRKFFGDDCYTYHLFHRSLKVASICLTYKKCLECCKTYEIENAGKSRRNP